MRCRWQHTAAGVRAVAGRFIHMSEIVRALVESVHAECLDGRSGEILHGIPALEDVDPDTFGICVATADGYV